MYLNFSSLVLISGEGYMLHPSPLDFVEFFLSLPIEGGSLYVAIPMQFLLLLCHQRPFPCFPLFFSSLGIPPHTCVFLSVVLIPLLHFVPSFAFRFTAFPGAF